MPKVIILSKIYEMIVYKFGGGILTDAAAVKNISAVLPDDEKSIVIVISAFGKTTNALEKLLGAWFSGDEDIRAHLETISGFHLTIAGGLDKGTGITGGFKQSLAELENYLLTARRGEYDFEYDQVVSYGELWSSAIVSAWLKQEGFDAEWVDIRNCLITDGRHRDANILWGESTPRVKNSFDPAKHRIYVTQGFIGGTAAGYTTTLGREGSDYTASVLVNMLDARMAVIWKDVPGVLNADPKWLNDAVQLEEISYKEAVEMAFSGAKIIHPKTVKPLHNKNIPLYIKSFYEPEYKGTLVTSVARSSFTIPVFVRKENQILVSILPLDFSFVMGDNLGIVFHTFMLHGIKVNLVQASAVSINVCVDNEKRKIEKLVDDLSREYKVLYNEDVEILTVMRHTREAIARVVSGREILLEQKTRRVVRFVVRRVK